MSKDRNILVFGHGRYFEAKKDAICGKIVGFLDNYHSEFYDGIPVYSPNQIGTLSYDAVYVMGAEVNFAEMVYQLLEHGVLREKIIIGQNLKSYPYWEETYMREQDEFVIDKENKLCFRMVGGNSLEFAFNTYDEFFGIRDVFCKHDYEFGIQGKTVVIDIGMNIGAASVYLAGKPNVERIYGFEPFAASYEMALYNFHKNPDIESKIHAENAGIDAEASNRKLVFNASMTCGLSTDTKLNLRAKNMYQEWGLYRDGDSIQNVQLLDAAEVFSKIYEENPNRKYVLKMDCEGTEYKILRRLYETKLLERLDIIMMEWHYLGDEMVRSYLEKSGFAYFSFPKDKNMGTIYAVRQKG